jgi:hypothetical protein
MPVAVPARAIGCRAPALQYVTASAELLLARMRVKIDDLFRGREALRIG